MFDEIIRIEPETSHKMNQNRIKLTGNYFCFGCFWLSPAQLGYSKSGQILLEIEFEDLSSLNLTVTTSRLSISY